MKNTQTCKMLIGVAIVIGIAVSWVGATQFAQSTYSPDFSAPFFTTWFSTVWMVVVFPVYFLPSLLRGKQILVFYRYMRFHGHFPTVNYVSFILLRILSCLIFFTYIYSTLYINCHCYVFSKLWYRRNLVGARRSWADFWGPRGL